MMVSSSKEGKIGILRFALNDTKKDDRQRREMEKY
jgi:hypothetical protein